MIRHAKVHYFLFSKTGFTKACMEKAGKMGNVTLVTYGGIVKVKKCKIFVIGNNDIKTKNVLVYY